MVIFVTIIIQLCHLKNRYLTCSQRDQKKKKKKKSCSDSSQIRTVIKFRKISLFECYKDDVEIIKYCDFQKIWTKE